MELTTAKTVRALRGTELRCKGWRQESILRMLENTLEVGEKPEDLIVYSAGKAARNWESYAKIVEVLRDLEDGETLLVQSGKPVARFLTNKLAPVVIVATNNIVSRWDDIDTFQELEKKGLLIDGIYTAAGWQYIGSQGILQTTYETFASIAQSFGGSLRSRFVLTSGLGGAGGPQPLAVKMNGGISLVVEVDELKMRRRVEAGYCDVIAQSLDEALEMIDEAKKKGTALSIGLCGNNSEIYSRMLERSIIPDVTTDQSPCHDNELLQYIPAQMSLEEAAQLRERNPKEYMIRARESIALLAKTILEFERRGSQIFEYGNGLRDQAQRAGIIEASRIPGFIEKYLRITHFCEGRSGQRWIVLSGDPRELEMLDDLILREFAADKQVVNWIKLAKEKVPIEGLPSRICWLSIDQQVRFGKLVNAMVRNGELKAPIAFTRCALPTCASPLDETRHMKDGSDAVADWPILNGMLDVAAGADLVNIFGSYAGTVKGSIFTLVIDGTKDSDERVRRVLLADAGLIITRLADAGYERATQITKEASARASAFHKNLVGIE